MIPQVTIHRVVIRVVNGISSTEAIERASIRLPGGSIKDVKFADDETMIVAYTEEGDFIYQLMRKRRSNHRPATKSHLLYIPYRKRSGSTSGVSYASISPKHNHTKSPETFTDLSTHDAMKHYIQHTFPTGPAWTPERIEVNGRKGRRAICVVAQDRMHYRIYDLDPPKADDGVDSGGAGDPNEATADDDGHMAVEPDTNA